MSLTVIDDITNIEKRPPILSHQHRLNREKSFPEIEIKYDT